MNKAELIANVHSKLDEGTSKAAAERAVAAVLEAVTDGIKSDGSVTLIGFGTFSVSERAARQGVNPRTGKPMPIPASKSIKFKPGAGLKKAVS